MFGSDLIAEQCKTLISCELYLINCVNKCQGASQYLIYLDS
jgi:hypothetical protein